MSDYPLAPAAIVGYGAVSAYGAGVPAFWQGLLEGRSGIGPLPENLQAYSRCTAAAVVDVDLLDAERPHQQRLSRSSLMALVAVREARASHTLDVNPARVGVVVGTGIGNLDLLDAALRQADARLSPALAFQSYAHAGACEVSRELGARGPVLTVSTGCNSGADAIGVALDWLRLGKCDLVYAGGTEAELVPGFLQAMTAARALQSRHNDRPQAASRPFDRQRDGNVPGEGAAFVVLAREKTLNGAEPDAWLYGAACRAFGTRPPYDPFSPLPDPSAMIATMQTALADGAIEPTQLSLVSANGSSSVFYDALEAGAIRAVFGEAIPVYSMKGALGQTGAVTPVLQTIAAVRSLTTGFVPPTINCDELDPKCEPLNLIRQRVELRPEFVMTHAIGFGGYYYAAQVLGRGC